MKYLNTNHLDLLASYGTGISVSGDFIKTSTSNTTNVNVFSITPPLNSNVYFSVNDNFNGAPTAGNAVSIGIFFSGTNNYVGVEFTSSSAKIKKMTVATATNVSTLWTGNAPIDANGDRIVHIRVDLTQHTVDLYSNGVLCAESINYGITSSSAIELRFGKVYGSPNSSMYFNNFIVSDAVFPPTERVTEITPTITTSDWTVADGVATSDTVGDTMTLTAPANSIDETQRGITGYSALFLDCGTSTNVNAVDVTQGSTTQQVVLPEGVGIETPNVFSVNQLSDISTTVVARSVSV